MAKLMSMCSPPLPDFIDCKEDARESEGGDQNTVLMARRRGTVGFETLVKSLSMLRRKAEKAKGGISVP